MSVQQEKFKEIANRIRQHLGGNELIKPNEFATKIDEVYSRGDTDGYMHGQADGIEQGRQAEWSDFWDVFQSKGNRTEWDYQFKGSYWNGDAFKPKYKMIVKTAGNMFSGNYSSVKIDLRKEALGVEVDFSQCTLFNNTFSYQGVISAIGVLDTRASSNLYNLFASNESLHTVEKLIFKDDGSQTNLNSTNAKKLKNILIEGVIGNSISFSASPLTKETIMGKSIIAEEYESLSDSVKTNNVIVIDGVYYYGGIITALKSDASGKTLTLKKTAVNEAFGINVDDETTYPEGSEYYTLRHSKDNWTFSYV